ncbi:DUF1294 domain-containing protein [bacterium]|nr:DUF1294 domain-containing protein [bacterium]
MDSFVLYLLVVNAAAFLAITADYFLCRRFPELDDTIGNSLILNVFPLAGGAVGAIAALFIWSGCSGGHRITKENIAWWFVAFACLIVWALIICSKFGLVGRGFEFMSLFTGWNATGLTVLSVYLGVINLVTLAIFAKDKSAAEKIGRSRIMDFSKRTPEAVLLGLCLIGGSIGGIVGMRVLRHKTRKWYFVWGLPFFILLDAGVIVYAHVAGLI